MAINGFNPNFYISINCCAELPPKFSEDSSSSSCHYVSTTAIHSVFNFLQSFKGRRPSLGRQKCILSIAGLGKSHYFHAQNAKKQNRNIPEALKKKHSLSSKEMTTHNYVKFGCLKTFYKMMDG